MRRPGTGHEPQRDPPDRLLWQHIRLIDATEDDAARFMDLAAFADDGLDADERERVAELVANDPDYAGDIAAARAALSATHASPPESVVTRACALVGQAEPSSAEIIAFSPGQRARRTFSTTIVWGARWGSVAAAVVIAGWLGFTLGMDTSLALAQNNRAPDESILQDLIAPASGLMRDLAEGA